MNAEQLQTPEITPQVVHLIDLLKRANEGRLRVPKFQREFVWRRQDIIDLFDSIARQYPIGTLFLWGSLPAAGSRPKIGPLTLPDYTGDVWLVLDGQQRLTTLVGVLLADDPQWSSEGDDDPERWSLFFDADSNSFAHVHAGEIPPPNYIPVPALLDTVKLFAQMEKLLAGNKDTAIPRREVFSWINRAQEVARAIQSYRIPLVEIKTNDLSIAVESFSRLNKKGRSIGQDEMFSALTYDEQSKGGFHLAAEIDKLQTILVKSEFGRVDRSILLRSVLAAANLDIYRADWNRFSASKQDMKLLLPPAVAEAAKGLQGAVTFLREIGVYNARMLPYSMQLVALSAFFGRCDAPTQSQRRLLTTWFWSSSFTGWFGAGNPSLVRRLVDELRNKISIDPDPLLLENMDIKQPALSIPRRFDLRSARVRALLCVLLANGPRRSDGSIMSLEESASLLLREGSDAMETLCATVGDPELRRSPANRIIDGSENIGQAKNWLLSLDESVREAVLTSHAITPESYHRLEIGEHDQFLAERMISMCKLEVLFMLSVGVTPPVDPEPALAPIDSGDEQGLFD